MQLLKNEINVLFDLKYQKLIELIKANQVDKALEYATKELLPICEKEVKDRLKPSQLD